MGGVAVARYGANPLEVIKNVKQKWAEIEPGLPQKILEDGTVSQVKIIPFYDRTQLIGETLGTLEEALTLEILITIIVVILMLVNLPSSLLVSSMLPVAVWITFITMRYLGVDANIVALAGIAIAIGTMVDMGIVLTESMVRHQKEAPADQSLMKTIHQATLEVGPAIITAVATTVISFLPVFAMEAAEGKLFHPLAYTKTFALVAAIVVALTLIPPLAHTVFSLQTLKPLYKYLGNALLLLAGLVLIVFGFPLAGIMVMVLGLWGGLRLWLQTLRPEFEGRIKWAHMLVYAAMVGYLLSRAWMPLGVSKSLLVNFLFVATVIGLLVGIFYLVIHFYEVLLRFFLRMKFLFLLLVCSLVFLGFRVFVQMGEEFMPALDEGSFLLMPSAMPHTGTQENIKNLRLLDMAVTAIPEVEMVVGKAGRVESALDPAPLSMYENVILYKSEYKTDQKGRRLRFRYDREKREYIRDEQGNLIPDKGGQYYRQWRDRIQHPNDIWEEIVKATRLPGLTSAPKLQPIETRLIMLQTGMRSPMGIKVLAGDLNTIESFGRELEHHLKQVEGIKEASVFADRIIGKPYLLLDIKREAISRHGLKVEDVQRYIQAAVGGMTMTTTVEGRERYGIRIRYPRELRDDPESLQRVYLPSTNGSQIPLGELVDIRYEQGPQSIKSEDGFLLGYVLFDKEEGYSEVGVVKNAQRHLNEQIEQGNLHIPTGVNYHFAGNYEQQVRASRRLFTVGLIALVIIFLVLYLQFRSILTSLMVFFGVFIACSGGFLLIGLYGQPHFMDVELLGTNLRDLFQIGPINMSVAVGVGFLALFGIATDDGVLVATFLKDSFMQQQPNTVSGIREAVVMGGKKRVRAAMMTSATTILALLPILTSTGRGAELMLPMAIPVFGGMLLQTLTMFTVPVLYSLWQEMKLKLFKSIEK